MLRVNAWLPGAHDLRPPARILRSVPSIATTRRKTAVVGVLYAVGGLIVLVGVAADRPERSLALAILGAAGIALGGALVAASAVRPWVLKALPSLGIVVVTADVLLAAGSPLSHGYALLYLFVVVDAFFFLDWRSASLHWVAVGVANLATTLATGVPTVEVGMLLAAFGVAGGVTGWLVRVATLAGVDPLTGLLDRGASDRELEAVVTRVARTGEEAAAFLIDLDAFSTLNHEQGIAAGDEVLVEVGAALAEVIGPSGIGCRFGSDEFLAICLGAGHAEATTTLSALRARLAPVTFSAAVTSIARADTRSAVAWRLMTGLQEARERGGAVTVAVDDDAISSARLIGAIDGGELEVHYQPIMVLPAGGMVSAEALVRWRDPERGLVPPDEFIPRAERDGSVVQMGRWVVEEVCRQMAQWSSTGAALVVAVNASHVELSRADYATRLLEVCRRYAVPPSSLVVEVTETTIARTEEHVLRNLETLRRAGLGVSIDDFGTGYSSLARIERMPVTQLKIDRSFVALLGRGTPTTPVLTAIIGLGAALGLEVVAEGIETEVQAAALGRLGVQHGQGFHFARPAPAAELQRVVEVRPPADPATNFRQPRGPR